MPRNDGKPWFFLSKPFRRLNFVFILESISFSIWVRLSDNKNLSLINNRRNVITMATFPIKTSHFLDWSVFNIDDRFEIYFPHECRTCESERTKTRIAFKRRTSNSKWIRKSWTFKWKKKPHSSIYCEEQVVMETATVALINSWSLITHHLQHCTWRNANINYCIRSKCETITAVRLWSEATARGTDEIQTRVYHIWYCYCSIAPALSLIVDTAPLKGSVRNRFFAADDRRSVTFLVTFPFHVLRFVCVSLSL